MSVSLPQNDKKAQERADALRAQRQKYRYDYSWPKGVATGAELQKEDDYGVAYVAKTVEVYAKLGVNMAELAVAEFDGKQVAKDLEQRFASIGHPSNLHEHLFTAPQDIASSMPKKWPETWDHYRTFFQTIPAVPMVSWMDKGGSDLDLAFAWQRMAGVNPMVLARITELPDHFPVDGARAASFLTGNDSLEAAAKEHRLYVADYAALDGITTGSTDGIQKYTGAPIALFAVDKTSGHLRPVAIQYGQSPDTPLVYPDQEWTWRTAQLLVQIADANFHEAIAHLGRTHLVMEAVGLAMHRQLGQHHPIHALLAPHLDTTFAINHSAKTSLIAPDGVVDRCFVAEVHQLCDIVKYAIDSYRLDQTDPLQDLAARGLDDDDALGIHPYRDDVRDLWKVVHDYVSEYLDLYYATDQDVNEDWELQAFVHELSANDGGRLRGVPTAYTRGELKRLIARFIFIAGPQHSAVNFPQFPEMGYVANMPGAAWAPIPTGEVTEAQYTRLQPPQDLAFEGVTTVYTLSEIRTSTFGDYGMFTFLDPRVKLVQHRFWKALQAAEKVIEARDAKRLISYPYLRPSQILQSISI